MIIISMIVQAKVILKTRYLKNSFIMDEYQKIDLQFIRLYSNINKDILT
jgi:hypothetical protein